MMPFGLPDIPNAPAAISAASLLTSDASSILGLLGFGSKPQWGIYKDGKAVIVPDSVVDVNYKNDWRIADYPMEQGSFQSYNKVNTPFDIKIRMTKGGKLADRTAFLNTIETLAQSLNLYDIVTPEKTYKSVNINHYDYRRTAHSGMGLIIVDIWLMEVRAAVLALLSSSSVNATVPSGADPLSLGSVQASIPSVAQLAPALEGVIAPITNGLSAAIATATPAMEAAVSSLSSTITSTLATATANITPALESAMIEVQSTITQITPALEANLSTAMETLTTNLSGLSAKLPELASTMQGIGENLTNSLSVALGGH